MRERDRYTIVSEIRALKKTKVVWSFLKLHPTLTKEQAYERLGLGKDTCLCPLCQYATGDCNTCPLKEFWLKTAKCKPILYSERYFCENKGTPYMDWCSKQYFPYLEEDRKRRSVGAGRIVEACDVETEHLEMLLRNL